MLQRQKERCIERGLLEMPAHSFFPTIAIEAAVVHYICKEGGWGERANNQKTLSQQHWKKYDNT
jgi:hypothetical protein